MTRTRAVALFGGARRMADAIGVTVARVYHFPPDAELPTPIHDRVLGAALRLGVLQTKAGEQIRLRDIRLPQ